jgi:hypothetical protein
MKKYLLTVILIIGYSLTIQAQTLDWAKQFGGTGTETGTVVKTDASGCVYTMGQFTADIDVNPGAAVVSFSALGNNNKSDIYLTKLDSAGNFLWAAQFGSTWSDFSVSMTIDMDQNVICSGIFDGTVDFDPGAGTYNMTSSSSGESFIVKLDSAGNFKWATQRTGYSGYDRNYGLETDSSGNIYTAGLFAATSDFDPGVGTNNLTSIGSYDIFVQKLDSDGNSIWVKQMGGTGADAVAYGMDVDVVGNIFITGYFTDTVDFNPSIAIADTMKLIGDINGDAFVVRLDNAGNFVWAAGLYGNFTGYGKDIVVDGLLNVYSYGTFDGTMDFDPNPNNTINFSSGVNNSSYISKLDASGNYLWAGKLGGANSNTEAQSIKLDAQNNIYVSGDFESGLTDFDPGAGTFNFTPVGSRDIFITKLTSIGNFVWAKQFGGVGYENSGDIEVDVLGNIYANGIFGDIADFDPDSAVLNLTPVSGLDAFLFKIKHPSNVSIFGKEVTFNLNVYPNPTSEIITVETQKTFTEINIYTIKGELLMKSKEKTFSLSSLPAGVYFLSVEFFNETQTIKIIKD